jgi:hypothetical protein
MQKFGCDHFYRLEILNIKDLCLKSAQKCPFYDFMTVLFTLRKNTNLKTFKNSRNVLVFKDNIKISDAVDLLFIDYNRLTFQLMG